MDNLVKQSNKFRGKYKIESTRLKHWDYSSNGTYFITICTKNRERFLGEIVGGEMQLSEIGKIVQKYWLEIPDHFSFIVLDNFIIMPNHVHGIVVIDNANNVETRQCLVSTSGMKTINRFQNQGKHTISSIIGAYKSICTKTINKIQNKIFFGWQSSFYDHIIRSENELSRIREYIVNNPIKWDSDRNNPENLYM